MVVVVVVVMCEAVASSKVAHARTEDVVAPVKTGVNGGCFGDDTQM